MNNAPTAYLIMTVFPHSKNYKLNLFHIFLISENWVPAQVFK